MVVDLPISTIYLQQNYVDYIFLVVVPRSWMRTGPTLVAHLLGEPLTERAAMKQKHFSGVFLSTSEPHHW